MAMKMKIRKNRPGYHIESSRFFRAFGIIPQALFYLTYRYRENNKWHDIMVSYTCKGATNNIDNFN